MLTPEMIVSKRFDKQMGGYKQDEVDAYLREVAQELTNAQREKKELEEKLELLAEKIEQYREDEDSLRSALIGAQKLGDSVIRESKAKAEYILRDAKQKADRMMDTAQRNIEREQQALVRMQKEVTKFKNRLLTLYRQHLEMIGALPEYQEEQPAPQAQQDLSPQKEERVPEETTATPEEVNNVVPTMFDPDAVASEVVEAAQELNFEEEPLTAESAFAAPEPASAAFHSHSAAGQAADSKFGPLKFGEGFDVERTDSQQGKSLFSRKKHR